MVAPLHVAFTGGELGAWQVRSIRTICGEPLEPVRALSIVEGEAAAEEGAVWTLRGVTSNERYIDRLQHDELLARQPPLGRFEATRAALIPITKSDEWWELPQDERVRIFEGTSRHVASGMEYLPAIARRLHHGRDLGAPFDFLTWFEFAPADEPSFDELVSILRGTEEWTFVEREVDIRLERDQSPSSPP